MKSSSGTRRTVELVLPVLHPGQAEIKGQAKRFNVLAAGRRWGKNVLGLDALVAPVLRGYPVAWFSPTYKYLAEDWRGFVALFYPIMRAKSEQEHRLELITDGVLEMWSLDDPDAARGRAYKRVVIDEAAKVQHLEYSWGAAIRPTLTDFEGDAWFTSTPKGLNFFWQLFRRGQDRVAFPDWRSWQRASIENPHLPAGEVEKARLETTGAYFAQEYEASFIEYEARVFRRVREAVGSERHDGPVPGGIYVFGVDWGKLHDFTAIAVVECRRRALVYLDRFKEIDYLFQVQRVKALFDRFQPHTIIPEINAMGIPVLEQLQRLGLPVQPFLTTQGTKAQIIESLAVAFEKGEIHIPDDPVLIGELESYQAEKSRTGLFSYSAPKGMHDDTVMALALAWAGAIPVGEQTGEVILGPPRASSRIPW